MRETSLNEYIDKTVKGLLRQKMNENKKQKVTTYVPIRENIQAIRKNYKLLREYMEYENEDGYNNGDEMLDNEISVIDDNTPEINKFIENIKSEALDAMSQLARNGESNSATFETLKKVFDVCHNTQKKKDEKKEVE